MTTTPVHRCTPECEPDSHIASSPPAVPRPAVFDDLRIGMWVAWIILDRVYGGRVTHKSDAEVRVASGHRLFLEQITLDTEALVILRDAPAPPVQVRREDYDALVAIVHASGVEWPPDSLHYRARVLIDNADLGSDDD